VSAERVDVAVAELNARYGGEEVALGEVLCDAHAESDAVALVYDGELGTQTLTYADLRSRSMRVAGVLRETGVREGDRVAIMLPKSPELLVSLVALWRIGAVHVPLFTAFGPDAVTYRVAHSRACVVITDTDNRAKLGEPEGSRVPVLCVARPGGEVPRNDLTFASAVERGIPFVGVRRAGDDLLILLYTSGTTGHPKGVEVPVRALASIHSYMRHSLDVRAGDVFWNIADPGWGYGLWFAVIGPLLLGHTTLLRGVPFDAEDAFAAMADHCVTNLTGAPTVYRALRAAGVPDGFRQRSRLRVASSAGEPLNAEVLDWSGRELGVEIHDHYGQSELGMPVGFAHDPQLHRQPVPGSMGFSAPGYRAVVLDGNGHEAGPGVDGELAIDVPASPLYWFRGYYNDPERTGERFRYGARYYLTGDAARMDEDGLLRFASRADDVITSSGYRIGPFEVESALMAHGAVAEVAVIGTPDELRGEAVTAFVVTAPSVSGTPELAEELQHFVKARLAKHLYPRHVVFVDALPRTPSGKIQRTVLREQSRTEKVGA
jgi:acetyl-CoA synthetase